MIRQTVGYGFRTALAGPTLLATLAGGSVPQEAAPSPNDSLNAVLWTQRSVEFKGNALGAYALARIRLDEALADATHTAAPVEQRGDFDDLPPAVILDVDETVLDTSLYQAWTVVDGQAFSPSAKSTRRAAIAKDYRILLLVGDNLGDFSDGYKGDEAARLKVYEDNAAHWGKDWIVVANPTYGSFETAPYGHDYKLPVEEQRAAKEKALEIWPGP